MTTQPMQSVDRTSFNCQVQNRPRLVATRRLDQNQRSQRAGLAQLPLYQLPLSPSLPQSRNQTSHSLSRLPAQIPIQLQPQVQPGIHAQIQAQMQPQIQPRPQREQTTGPPARGATSNPGISTRFSCSGDAPRPAQILQLPFLHQIQAEAAEAPVSTEEPMDWTESGPVNIISYLGLPVSNPFSYPPKL